MQQKDQETQTGICFEPVAFTRLL